MPRFVLLCPPGRLMTEEEKKILYGAQEDLEIKIIECHGQFCFIEGEEDAGEILRGRLSLEWRKGQLVSSVRR